MTVSSLESVFPFILIALLALQSKSILFRNINHFRIGVNLHSLRRFLSLNSAFHILFLISIIATFKNREATSSSAATGWAIRLTNGLLLPTLAQWSLKSLAISYLLHGLFPIVGKVVWLLLRVRQRHLLRNVPRILVQVLRQNGRRFDRWNGLLGAIILVLVVALVIILIQLELVWGGPAIIPDVTHISRHSLYAVEVRWLPVNAARLTHLLASGKQSHASCVTISDVLRLHALVLALHLLLFHIDHLWPFILRISDLAVHVLLHWGHLVIRKVVHQQGRRIIDGLVPVGSHVGWIDTIVRLREIVHSEPIIVDILLICQVECRRDWNFVPILLLIRSEARFESVHAYSRASHSLRLGSSLAGWSILRVLAMLLLKSILNHFQLIFVFGIESQLDFVISITSP